MGQTNACITVNFLSAQPTEQGGTGEDAEMLRCLREETVFGRRLPTGSKSKTDSNTFLKQQQQYDVILEEINYKRNFACQVFQMHRLIHGTDIFFFFYF